MAKKIVGYSDSKLKNNMHCHVVQVLDLQIPFHVGCW